MTLRIDVYIDANVAATWSLTRRLWCGIKHLNVRIIKNIKIWTEFKPMFL